MLANMLFKQIKSVGDNFSYVIADEPTGEAVVVDPGFNAEAILRYLEKHGLKARYVINTHSHYDHVTDNDKIASKFGAEVIAHTSSTNQKDIEVDDNSLIQVGEVKIKVIHTPGHTPDSICLLIDNKLLTGDTLFVGECGRTDLPGGNAKELYYSLFGKLMKLDDEVEVYPGHDYGVRPYSTIGLEKKTNYVLKKRTLEEFIEFMGSP